ncbi:alpha/beta hydrolase [Aurantiacibacter sp. DGU5]|uniref:Alpha/beta hydrolase n=1 Tax=Aurantiacibacter flavus TaxID=3145232 RepID=A0ABV0CU34_9SPHN
MRNTLREGLALPALLANPLRPPRKGKRIGEGRAVLVIPGLATGDVSTLLMRRTLRARGFVPSGWRLGMNHGADLAKLARLEARIAALHSQTGRKVVLIGWSLGGLYARILGQRVPGHIASVITVGSPFSGGRRDNAGWRYYEMINDHTVDNPPFAEDFSIKPPVPTVAIWSAIDGIVAAHSARGRDDESDLRLEVRAQHFALGTSRRCIEQVIEAITMADALG